MQTTEERRKRPQKRRGGGYLLPAAVVLIIAALAAVAVTQGLRLREIGGENTDRAAQLEEQAKQIEEREKQLEEQEKQIREQAEQIREQTKKIEELQQQNQQQAEKLKEAENKQVNVPTVDPNGPSYQSLYPDFYAPQALDATVSKAKTAYLTFDDGPSENTDTILQTLQEEGVKATFFVIGRTGERDLARMRRIVEEGHTIGMHSYSHSYDKIYASVDAFLEDMYRVFTLIKDTTGITPTCFRFPGGSINDFNKAVYKDIKAEMMRRGFVPYDWNVSSGDATSVSYTPEQLAQNVLNGISGKNRAIILMHDAAAKKSTAQAVGQMIAGIRDKGFSMEALDYHVKPILF